MKTCTDASLVFAPLTEAKLFPYLSLPMIAGYLRESGYSVQCHDLNLALSRDLFTSDHLLAKAQEIEAAQDLELHQVYRLEMARFLEREHEGLWSQVFSPVGQKDVAEEDLRSVNQGVSLLLEDSVLNYLPSSLSEIDELVSAHERGDSSDRGLTTYLEQLDQIVVHNPSVIGFSVAFFSQMLPSLIGAAYLKRRQPESLIIFGGQQILLRSHELAELACVKKNVDALGVGPGEEAMVGMVEYARGRCNRTDVCDTVWPRSSDRGPRSKVTIRDVPPPDFTDLPIHGYANNEFHLPLLTCVGCYWGRCAFCSYGLRSRKVGYQQKSPDQIANECEHLVKKYKATRINFVDENTNLKLVTAAMEKLSERGIHIQFSTRNRFEPVLLDLDFVQRLADLGCVLMSVGYDTNSQRIIDKVQKGVDVANYQPIIDNCHTAGINLRLSVMGGLPEETEEERRASEIFLAENSEKIGIDVMQMLVAEPGTLIAKSPDAYGYTVDAPQELRGNRLLNFGGGRFGLALEFNEGPLWGERLKKFAGLYKSIAPQKNDGLAPSRRLGAQRRQIRTLRMSNRVAIATAKSPTDGRNRRYLLDLVWEGFHHLPSDIEIIDDNLLAHSQRAEKILSSLAANGLGKENHIAKEEYHGIEHTVS